MYVPRTVQSFVNKLWLLVARLVAIVFDGITYPVDVVGGSGEGAGDLTRSVGATEGGYSDL